MSSLLTSLRPLLSQNKIDLSELQLEQLAGHFEVLCHWNQRMSLTTITNPEAAARLHYLDALAAAPYLEALNNEVEVWVDVGSGGGFPGVPLSIMFHVEHFWLTDSQHKKALFLNEVVQNLGLESRVKVFEGRVEAGQLAGLFGTEKIPRWGILARAIEKLDKQLPKLLKLPGLHAALVWVGGDTAQTSSQNPPRGWTVETAKLPSGDQRYLLMLRRNP
ncbi:MAG: class I SAM-dependent methyltransferase [Acidobacteria bacterium]|nr:class I SAM-dependent methyltransferase [Acidobacteriota bacterium]